MSISRERDISPSVFSAVLKVGECVALAECKGTVTMVDMDRYQLIRHLCLPQKVVT